MREKGVLRVADQYLSEEWGAFIILNEYYLFLDRKCCSRYFI